MIPSEDVLGVAKVYGVDIKIEIDKITLNPRRVFMRCRDKYRWRAIDSKYERDINYIISFNQLLIADLREISKI